MKGVLLSGGTGSRLYPITTAYSKQLLPVYDKPLIYYPLCTLMSLNIRDILCITTSEDQSKYKSLLFDGSQWGVNIKYACQDEPKGIADSLSIAKDYIKNDSVTLILGDNIFYGSQLNSNINNNFDFGAHLFLYKVQDPQRYGVAEVKNDKIISLIEKPEIPKSSLAVTGLYIYDKNVINYVNTLTPSKRNELEITDLNNIYLKNDTLKFTIMEKGSVWLDAGTPASLLQASEYVKTIQERQQIQISAPEEIAFFKNWIDKKKLMSLSSYNYQNFYGEYLRSLIL